MEVNSENLIATSPATTPGQQKKLKQTRLPFAILSPVSTTEKPSTITTLDTKKRKLSGGDDGELLPAAKVNKKKENTQVCTEIVDLVDDSDNDASEESNVNESSDKIRIKLAVKKNNKKLKLEQSTEKAKKGHKKVSKKEEVPMEVVCIDDEEEDDEPKPLETSVLEDPVDSEQEEEDFKGFETSKELPKPDIQEKSEKLAEVSDLDVTADLNESQIDSSATKAVKLESTPGSGIKSRSLRKLSEEEKLKRQQERDEARRIERESKEAAKRQEREAKEAIRLKEKQEREAKLQKEKEEKENQRKLEKEERDKKKQAELEQKAEEKRQKELKKEEEKLKKEQEKQQKEEEERRKKEEAGQKWKKSAQLMEKFFVQKKTDAQKPEEESSNDSERLSGTCQNFMPFQVKENMRVAPCTRGCLDQIRREMLEKTLNNGEPAKVLTYLSQLKRDSGYRPGKSSSVLWQEEDDSQDIIIIDTKGGEHQLEQVKQPKKKYRAKFLHFHENRRPAYYGTWRKKSKKVSGKNPFGVDLQMLDYEVDSDEEWEEEEPGESLHGSDDEKDKDNVDDDYEVDNDFFVPHGHLSDEEIEPDDDLVPEDNSPEAQKARLKIMQQEFVEEHKKKTEKIKPRIIGCIWVRKSHGHAQDQCSPIIWEMLSARAMIFSLPLTTIPDDPVDEKPEPAAPKKVKITEDGIKELIRLVHGNPNSKKFLSDEFSAYRKQKYGENEGYQEFSFITTKIKEIAEYKQSSEDGPMYKVNAWFVKPEILEKYQFTNLPIINTWQYVLTPKSIITKDSTSKKVEKTPASAKKVPVTEEAMPDLIKLVHGNTRNRQFLIEEFRTFRKNTYGHLPDFQEFYHISSRIQQIAEYKKCEDEGPMKGKMAYLVHEKVLKQYAMEDISLPNTWKYHAVEKKKEKAPKTEVKEKEDEELQPGAGPLTKYAAKLAEEERMKKAPQPPPPAQKKRVQLLMSVPRGEIISETKKNNLISQFLQKSKNEHKTPQVETKVAKNDDDDVMIID